MSRQPRFEVVRSDAEQPWHARFRSANGAVRWNTENYTKRRGAFAAILDIAKECHPGSTPWLHAVFVQPHGAIEVRIIDERGATS